MLKAPHRNARITHTALMLLFLLACLLPASQAAQLKPAAASERTGAAALAWAENSTPGTSYQWGGEGPSGYDCSGLAAAAYSHAGITLPHSTYAMLTSPLLTRTSTPQPGDLAFFGTGHVELYIQPGETYGAQRSGTTAGPHHYSGSWAPTAFYRVT